MKKLFLTLMLVGFTVSVSFGQSKTETNAAPTTEKAVSKKECAPNQKASCCAKKEAATSCCSSKAKATNSEGRKED